MPTLDFTKRYTHSSGGFSDKDGHQAGSYAAYTAGTGCWNGHYANGTPFDASKLTEPVGNTDWHGAGPQMFINSGAWVELPDSPVITAQEEQEMNPIFGYQASQELNSDSWKQLVLASKDFPSVDVLKDTFKEWEAEYKEVTKQEIPGAWRSAKSVIKNAIANGVRLLDDEDKPLGKTAVETAVKSSKAHSVSAVLMLDASREYDVRELISRFRADGLTVTVLVKDSTGASVIYK